MYRSLSASRISERISSVKLEIFEQRIDLSQKDLIIKSVRCELVASNFAIERAYYAIDEMDVRYSACRRLSGHVRKTSVGSDFGNIFTLPIFTEILIAIVTCRMCSHDSSVFFHQFVDACVFESKSEAFGEIESYAVSA